MGWRNRLLRTRKDQHPLHVLSYSLSLVNMVNKKKIKQRYKFVIYKHKKNATEIAMQWCI